MSCNTHIRNYLNHCPPKHSWQAWKRFEKYFMGYRTDKQSRAKIAKWVIMPMFNELRYPYSKLSEPFSPVTFLPILKKIWKNIYWVIAQKSNTDRQTETQALTTHLRPASQRDNKPSKIKLLISKMHFLILTGIFLCMRPANGSQRFISTLSLIGWVHKMISVSTIFDISNSVWIVDIKSTIWSELWLTTIHFLISTGVRDFFCVCVQPMGDSVTL